MKFRKFIARLVLLLVTPLLILAIVTPAYAGTFPGKEGDLLIGITKSGGYSQLYTVRPNGDHMKQLTDTDGCPNYAAGWNASGTKIVFSSKCTGSIQIYTMNADGSDRQQLTNVGTNNNQPSFSPDGNKIAFQSNVSGNGNYIYTMNTDGSDINQLSTTGCLDPSWSPDGKIILCRSGNEIFSIDAFDGSTRTLFTNTSGKLNIVGAGSWSPDGSKIEFFSNRDHTGSNYEVYIMNADGSNLTRVTTNGGTGTAWSPNGGLLYFNSDRDGDGNDEVYSVKPDGDNVKQVLKSATASYSVYSVQPLTISPKLGNDSVNVNAGESATVKVLANDSSVYSAMDPTSVKVISQPSLGRASVNKNGTITYVASKATSGSDSFNYQACASINDKLCNTATVSIKVNPAAIPGAPDTGFGVPNQSDMILVGAGLVVAGLALAFSVRWMVRR